MTINNIPTISHYNPSRYNRLVQERDNLVESRNRNIQILEAHDRLLNHRIESRDLHQSYLNNLIESRDLHIESRDLLQKKYDLTKDLVYKLENLRDRGSNPEIKLSNTPNSQHDSAIPQTNGATYNQSGILSSNTPNAHISRQEHHNDQEGLSLKPKLVNTNIISEPQSVFHKIADFLNNLFYQFMKFNK